MTLARLWNRRDGLQERDPALDPGAGPSPLRCSPDLLTCFRWIRSWHGGKCGMYTVATNSAFGYSPGPLAPQHIKIADRRAGSSPRHDG
jgi:hypothetical protein